MTSTAPEYIDRDSYTGRWQLTRTDATLANRGQLIGVDTAAAHAANHGAGEVFTLWEYVGRIRGGAHLFHRSRFVANADGSLNGYDSEGRLVIRHPSTRDVRYLGARTH